MKVVISGHYGGINVGDDAILCSLAAELRQLWGDGLCLTAFSHNPEVTKQQAAVNAVQQMSFSSRMIKELYKMINVIRESDCIVIGGGGLLQDEFNIHTVPRYLLPALLGKLHGKKVVLYALGVGPLNRSYSMNCIKLISKQVDHVTVRDTESKQIMEQMGVTNVDVVPDPAVCLPKCSEKRARDILREENIDVNERPKIGISLRGFYHTDERRNKPIKSLSMEQKQTIVKRLETVADQIGGLLVFFSSDSSMDKSISEEIAQQCRCETRLIKRQYPPTEFAGILGAMDIVISMPLHSAIIASISYVPVIAINYNPKVRNYMRLIGHEESVLPMEQLSLLDRKTIQLWHKTGPIHDDLVKQIGKLQEESRKHLQRTIDPMRTGGKTRSLALILLSGIYMGLGLVPEHVMHKYRSKDSH